MKALQRLRWSVGLLFAFTIVLVLARRPPAARGAWVNVTKVVDGDTIYVDGKTKVRLKCVDTPETKDTHKKPMIQCYGPEASKFTTESLMGKRVRLEFDPKDARIDYKDHRGRELAFVYLQDGSLFNLQLARLGYGRTEHYPCSRKDDFEAAERKAREGGLGLWGECECVGKFEGNRRSMIYHRPDQEHYDMSDENRVCFDTEEQAKRAGYTLSKK